MDDNDIYVVGGLESCTKLQELHVARQRLPKYQPLEFEPQSLNAISSSLEVLEISGNAITNISQFGNMLNLRKLFCADNDIQEISELVSIISLPRLQEARFMRNPCCNTKRYRDQMIGASSDSLRILDDIPLIKHQQVAIKGLQHHRQKLGVDESTKKEKSYEDELDFAVVPINNDVPEESVQSSDEEFPQQNVDTGDATEPVSSRTLPRLRPGSEF